MSPRNPIRLLAGQSDERLLSLARDGQERAFEALLGRYRRPLLRYCRRMRLADGRAEDVLQQSFLQAWLALQRGTQVRDVKPWLYRIVHNTAVNSMRRAMDDGVVLAELAHAARGPGGDCGADARLAVREALCEVAALPEMQRQAICLTALAGHSHEEVASALGISDGAVRGLLYRARATLRSAAAAITPTWLIARASGSGASATSAERVAELSSGGAGAGVAGVLAKGAAVAATAGALATGVHIGQHPRHDARHPDPQPASLRTLRPDARQAPAGGTRAHEPLAFRRPRPAERGDGITRPDNHRGDGSSPAPGGHDGEDRGEGGGRGPSASVPSQRASDGGGTFTDGSGGSPQGDGRGGEDGSARGGDDGGGGASGGPQAEDSASQPAGHDDGDSGKSGPGGGSVTKPSADSSAGSGGSPGQGSGSQSSTRGTDGSEQPDGGQRQSQGDGSGDTGGH